MAIGAVVVAGPGDDHLGDLRQAVGSLDEIFQAFLGCETPHSKQVFTQTDAVLVKK